MVDRFRDWDKNRHTYAKAWKEKTGGKVVGYFCTYVPEEILYAANILPVRILGGHEPQDVSEAHIFGMFCPFCRDCLAQGDDSYDNVTIEKGSITIDGVSLTVINSKKGEFSVAIIPYTYEHTNFSQFKIGVTVNLEFDVIGKYLKRLSQGYF